MEGGLLALRMPDRVPRAATGRARAAADIDHRHRIGVFVDRDLVDAGGAVGQGRWANGGLQQQRHVAIIWPRLEGVVGWADAGVQPIEAGGRTARTSDRTAASHGAGVGAQRDRRRPAPALGVHNCNLLGVEMGVLYFTPMRLALRRSKIRCNTWKEKGPPEF
jgi:hypothetical protein